MNIALSLNTAIKNKASSEDFATMNSTMIPSSITIDDFVAHISEGYAFTPAYLKKRGETYAHRNTESFVSAQLIAVDIDNSIEEVVSVKNIESESNVEQKLQRRVKRRRTENEGYVSIADVMRDEFVMNNLWCLYTSPSHKEDWHRFRLVFCLPEPIRDHVVYRRFVQAFIERFDADPVPSSAVSIFYGSTTAIVEARGNVLSLDTLERIMARREAVRSEERKTAIGVIGTPDPDVVRAMLERIPKKVSYMEWVKIISAIADRFDEETTVQLVEEWSAGYEGEVAYKVRHKLETIHFGTLVFIAKQYGWMPSPEFYAGFTAKEKHVVMTQLEQLASALYGWRYNVISGFVQYLDYEETYAGWQNADDRFVKSLLRRIRQEGLTVKIDQLWEILDSDFVPTFNPFVSYFESLPEWDGDDRIEQLVDAIPIVGHDGEERIRLANLVFKRWLIGAVACSVWNKPNHICPILQGDQGVGKTMFFEKIIPPELEDYVYSGDMGSDKDSAFRLADNFLIIDDELSSTNHKEVETIKRLVTQSFIKHRRPYARLAEARKRTASFCGTGNKSEFLTDETGSRRFPVIRADADIDRSVIEAMDKRQLWAQALYLYNKGERHWFDREEQNMIEDSNKMYQSTKIEDDLFIRYFSPASKDEEGARHMTALEILSEINRIREQSGESILPITQTAKRAMGMALAKHKAEKYGKRYGKKIIEGYAVKRDVLT